MSFSVSTKLTTEQPEGDTDHLRAAVKKEYKKEEDQPENLSRFEADHISSVSFKCKIMPLTSWELQAYLLKLQNRRLVWGYNLNPFY